MTGIPLTPCYFGYAVAMACRPTFPLAGHGKSEVEFPSVVIVLILNLSTLGPACFSSMVVVLILLRLSTGGGVLRLWRYWFRKALAKSS